MIMSNFWTFGFVQNTKWYSVHSNVTKMYKLLIYFNKIHCCYYLLFFQYKKISCTMLSGDSLPHHGLSEAVWGYPHSARLSSSFCSDNHKFWKTGTEVAESERYTACHLTDPSFPPPKSSHEFQHTSLAPREYCEGKKWRKTQRRPINVLMIQ